MDYREGGEGDCSHAPTTTGPDEPRFAAGLNYASSRAAGQRDRDRFVF